MKNIIYDNDSKNKWFQFLVLGVLILIFIIFCLINFQPFFFADELMGRGWANTGNLIDGFCRELMYKPRIVSNAIITLGYRIFYYDRMVLIITGAFFQAIAVYFLWSLLVGSMGLNKIVAFVSVLFLAVNRFNYVCLREVEMAIIEGSGLVMFVLTLKTLIIAIRTDDFKSLVWATTFAYITYLCHERYGVLLIAILILCIYNWFRYRKKELVLIALLIIPLLASFPLVGFLLGSAGTFNATGGQPSSFDPHQITEFFSHALLQLINVNWGYAYLVATPFDLNNSWHITIGACSISLVILSILLLYKRNDDAKSKEIFIAVFLLIFILLPLLLMASLSQRIELRWLWQPYILVVVIISTIVPPSKKNILLLLSSFVFFLSNITYIQNVNNLYYVVGSNYAKDLGQNIVNTKKNASICFVIADETRHSHIEGFLRGDLFATNISPDLKLIVTNKIPDSTKVCDKVIIDTEEKIVELQRNPH